MEQPHCYDDLVQVLSYLACEGFGFNCPAVQSSNSKKPAMYLFQAFQRNPSFGEHVCEREYEEADWTKMRMLFQSELPELGDEIWMHDWLGIECVGLHVRHFNRIPDIFNVFLQNGYKLRACNVVNCIFLPGDVFSKVTLEKKLIEALEYAKSISGFEWQTLMTFVNFRSFMKTHNYVTREGVEFCKQLRAAMRKERDTSSAKSNYMTIPVIDRVAEKYGVLHRGGWWANTILPPVRPAQQNVIVISDGVEQDFEQVELVEKGEKDAEQDIRKIQDPVRNETSECMICMAVPPTTRVHPCECKVVCGNCSRGLENTADKSVCCYCRRKIERVEYGA